MRKKGYQEVIYCCVLVSDRGELVVDVLMSINFDAILYKIIFFSACSIIKRWPTKRAANHVAPLQWSCQQQKSMK
jgi:hypothetical protein